MDTKLIRLGFLSTTFVTRSRCATTPAYGFPIRTDYIFTVTTKKKMIAVLSISETLSPKGDELP